MRGDNSAARNKPGATVAEPAGQVEAGVEAATAPATEAATDSVRLQTAATTAAGGDTNKPLKPSEKTAHNDTDSEDTPETGRGHSNISSQDSHDSPALSEAETLLQLAAGTPAKVAARKRQHASNSGADSNKKRQRAASENIAAALAAAAAAESAEQDTDTDDAVEAVTAAAEAGASTKKWSGRKGYKLEDLPDGRKNVSMSFHLSKSSTFRIPVVPRELAEACFPESCSAQLSFVIDDQPVAETDEPVIVRIVRCDSTVHGRPRVSYQMKRVNALYERYSGCTVTGMSAAASTISSIKQLTLHLRSPAATALAQYAAAAAEAALDCCSTWHTHKFQASDRRLVVHNGKDVRIHVPGALIRAAYPGPPELPFRVQVSMVKDGQKMGSAGLRGSTVTKKRQLNLPAKLLRVMDGCVITRLRAAAPNFLQVHVRSDHDISEDAYDADAAAAEEQLAMAAAAAAAAGTWHKHRFEGAHRRHIEGDTKEIRQHVPGSLIKAAYGTPELPFKVQLSLHRDGTRLGADHDYAQGTISNKRQLHIPFKWLRLVEGCTLSHLKAKAPNYLQVHVLSSDVGDAVDSDAEAVAGTQAAAAVERASAEESLQQQQQQSVNRQDGNAAAAATQQNSQTAAATVVGASMAQKGPAVFRNVVDGVSREQQGAGQLDCSEAPVSIVPQQLSEGRHQQQQLPVQEQQGLPCLYQQQPTVPQVLQQQVLAQGQQGLLLFNHQQQAVPQAQQQQHGVMQRLKPARLGQLRGRLNYPHAAAAAKPIEWGRS